MSLGTPVKFCQASATIRVNLNPDTMAYDLTITDAYGYNDVIGFESPYDAEEQLLDRLDRCIGSRADYELRALLSVVEGDIQELEREEEGEEG